MTSSCHCEGPRPKQSVHGESIQETEHGLLRSSRLKSGLLAMTGLSTSRTHYSNSHTVKKYGFIKERKLRGGPESACGKDTNSMLPILQVFSILFIFDYY